MWQYNYNVEKELYHHGIVGMRWGVRRYQNADGSLTPLGQRRYGKIDRQNEKAQTAKTIIGRKYHAMNAEEMKSEIKRSDNVHNAKGLWKKGSQLFGYGAVATLSEGRARGYERKAELSKTKLGKQWNNTSAKNSQYYANFAEKMYNKNATERIVAAFYPVDFWTMPQARLSGRTTTVGRMFVDQAFTGGVAGLIMDANYLAKHHKSKE